MKTEKSFYRNICFLMNIHFKLAQNLLKEQFTEISGFQDTVTGKTQSSDIVKTNENFIQLLNVGSLHWVCVTNVSENKIDKGECQLYDSLSNAKVSPDVGKQIAASVFCDLPEILVEIKEVQQQTNLVDCGIFAIAFATRSAFAEDPADVTYDPTKLRMRLIKCLDKKTDDFLPYKHRKACLKMSVQVSCN